MLFLEFRHIETDQCTLVAEKERSQGLCQLGLTSTSRAKEEERTHGLSLLAQTRTGLVDGIEHLLHGMILPNHALFQGLFSTHQTVALLGLHLTERYTGLLSHYGTQVVALQVGTLLSAQLGQLIEDTCQEVNTLLNRGYLAEVGI